MDFALFQCFCTHLGLFLLVETANQAASHQTVASALFLLLDGFFGRFGLVQLVLELMTFKKKRGRKKKENSNRASEREKSIVAVK